MRYIAASIVAFFMMSNAAYGVTAVVQNYLDANEVTKLSDVSTSDFVTPMETSKARNEMDIRRLKNLLVTSPESTDKVFRILEAQRKK